MQVLDRVTAAHEKLEFGEAGRAFYDFFWAQYADWYIESAKTRLYSSDPAVAQTTRKVREPQSVPVSACRLWSLSYMTSMTSACVECFRACTAAERAAAT